jgi:PAS domain S-box-containing protein
VQAFGVMVTTSARDGWPALFTAAFRQSSNAMALVDDRRRHVDVNGAYLDLIGYERAALVGRPIYELVAGGPLLSADRWAAQVSAGDFAGEAQLVRADGSTVSVQWGAHAVLATGQRLVLLVALSTSRWGGRFRRKVSADAASHRLSARELEIVGRVALGHSGPEIAAELRIAHETVRTHVRNAMIKVGARSRAHLVAKTLAEGTIAL